METPTLEQVKKYFKNAKEVREYGYNKTFVIDWNNVWFSDFKNWCTEDEKNTHYLWSKTKGYAEIISFKTDSIVESVVNQFKERSIRGIEKYGTTLQENNTDDFLQHFKEELMDAILYIQKLQSQRNESE